MRVLFLALALLAAAQAVPTPPAGPAKVEAREFRNGTELRAVPGALTATRGGLELWRRTGPLAAPSTLNLWATAREVLLLSRDWRAGTVLLSAYALETGRPLWINRVYDRYANADAGFRGMAGRTLLLSGTSGEPIQGRVFGISVDTGKTVWQAKQDLIGFTDAQALILNLGLGAGPMNSPHLLPLTRVNAATGAQTKFTLTLPTRPGCGPMNYQGSIPDLRSTNRYLYAFRQDSCGKFIVRFPWRGDAHTPLVYPDRRPPTPGPPGKLH